MKRTILSIAAAALLVVACNHTPKELTHDQLHDSIEVLETQLQKVSPIDPVDTALGNNMLALCLQFADRYPDDTLAAHYLHRAAYIALSMDLIDDMVACYDRIIDYLIGRVDKRSQFPSAKGKNFQFHFLGLWK